MSSAFVTKVLRSASPWEISGVRLGERPDGGELGRTGQVQCPRSRLLVEPRLDDVDQRVEVRGCAVGEFVAYRGRGDPAGPAQEERAAQLPFQGAYL